MGRRIKEEAAIHRARIAKAAEQLFMVNGIEATSMNQIAIEAGYSKATIYVYFNNKVELIGYLVLASMEKLKEYLSSAICTYKNCYKDKFLDICNAMVKYEEEYPFYFSLVLDYINIDLDGSNCLESERETYQVGEEINILLIEFLNQGITSQEIKEQDNLKALIFNIWAMISGLINLSVSKEAYIKQEICKSKNEFLEKGFNLLYDSIKKN